jgi:hypothetical protein
VTESQIQAGTSPTRFACPFHAGLIPAIPGSAMQDFRIFHTIVKARITSAAMAGNKIVVVRKICFVKFVAVAGVVLPATTGKYGFRQSKKPGQPGLDLTI